MHPVSVTMSPGKMPFEQNEPPESVSANASPDGSTLGRRERSMSPALRVPVMSGSHTIVHVCGTTVTGLGKKTYVSVEAVAGGAVQVPFARSGTMVAFSRVVVARNDLSNGPFDVNNVLGSGRAGPTDGWSDWP